MIAGALGHFVDALLEAWKGCKADKADSKLTTFKAIHGSKLQVVFKPADLELIYANLKTPQLCIDAVYQAVNAHALGKSMFGDTLQTLLSNQCSETIEKTVIDALQGMKLTPELWKQVCRSAVEKVNASDPEKTMKSKRTVLVDYRGVGVMCKVSSILGEVELWLAACLRAKTVFGKDLYRSCFAL